MAASCDAALACTGLGEDVCRLGTDDDQDDMVDAWRCER